MKKIFADTLKHITTSLKVWDKLSIEQRVDLIKLNRKFEVESGAGMHDLYTDQGVHIRSDITLLEYIEQLEKGHK